MKKPFLALFMTMIILCCFAMSGCGKSSGGNNNPGDAAAAPVPITYFQNLRGLDPNTDRIIKEIEKICNVKFDFIDVPDEQYDDRLNLMVSTGEHIDLIRSGIRPFVDQWAKDGFIISFDDYVKDGKNPYVKAVIDNDMYNYLMVDGKHYYKPMPSWTGNRGYIINQDWLDNVGLKVPTTIDELYEVSVAFAFGDPDNNGVPDDTFGFFVAEPYGSNTFGYIARAYINTGAWGGTWCEMPDGSIDQFAVTDYARDAFRFINKCYNEGLFNKSFVTEVDFAGKVDDLMIAEKIGWTDMSGSTILDMYTRYEAVGKDMNLSYMPPLKNYYTGKQGVLPGGSGWYQAHYMPKTCKNPEKVVELLDWLLTDEGKTLTNFGIQGVHWDDFYTANGMRYYNVNQDEMTKDWSTTEFGYTYPLSGMTFNYINNAYIPIKENNFDFSKAFREMIVCQPHTMADYGFANWTMLNSIYVDPFPLQDSVDPQMNVTAELEDIEIEGRIKAIIGSVENFDANWDDMVSQFLGAGGRELIERANEYWKTTDSYVR